MNPLESGPANQMKLGFTGVFAQSLASVEAFRLMRMPNLNKIKLTCLRFWMRCERQ